MRRWIRRAARALAVLLVIVAVAAAALWFGRHWAAERAIVAALDSRGIEAALTVETVDESHAVLTGVTIGADQTLRAERIVATYDIAAVQAGRIDTLELDGAVLRMRVDAGGASLGELDPLLEGGGGDAVPLPRIALREARLELDTPAGPATVALDGTLTPDERGGFAAAGSSRVQMPHLTLAADLKAEGTFTDMEARLTITGGHASWPDGALDALGGTARLAIADGVLLSAQAALNAGTGHAAGIPLKGATLSAEAVAGGLEAILFASSADDDVFVEAALDTDLDAVPMTFTSDGVLKLARTSEQMAALGVPEIEEAEARWTIAGSGNPQEIEGELSIALGAAALRLPGVEATRPSGTYGGRFTWRGGRLTLRADEPVMLRVQDAEVAGIGALDAPLELAASESGGPLMTVDPSRETAPVVLELRIAETPFALTADQTRMRGTLPAVTLAGAGGTLAVNTEGGRIDLPEKAIAVSTIEASYDTGWRRGELRIGMVRDLVEPAAFAPIEVTGEIARDGLVWIFDGNAWAVRGTVAAHISARHDPESGQGGVDWTVPRLAFAPGKLQPSDVAPALGDVIEDADGSLSISGSVRWAEGPTRIRFAADLAQTSLDAGGVPMKGASGTIRYDNLAADPPYDTLRVDHAMLGMPLTNTTMEWRLMPDFNIQARSLRGRFAGGRVFSDGFTIDPRAQVQEFVLEVEGVSMSQVVEIADVPGLAATGTLSGRIPVRIEDGDVIVRGGRLSSADGGTLAYTPDEPPAALTADNQGVELMMQAFENFRYDELTAEIEKQPGGETRILLHLAGRNPDALEGQLFNFNINLSGNATEIMNCLFAGECGAGGGLRLDQ